MHQNILDTPLDEIGSIFRNNLSHLYRFTFKFKICGNEDWTLL